MTLTSSHSTGAAHHGLKAELSCTPCTCQQGWVRPIAPSSPPFGGSQLSPISCISKLHLSAEQLSHFLPKSNLSDHIQPGPENNKSFRDFSGHISQECSESSWHSPEFSCHPQPHPKALPGSCLHPTHRRRRSCSGCENAGRLQEQSSTSTGCRNIFSWFCSYASASQSQIDLPDPVKHFISITEGKTMA